MATEHLAFWAALWSGSSYITVSLHPIVPAPPPHPFSLLSRHIYHAPSLPGAFANDALSLPRMLFPSLFLSLLLTSNFKTKNGGFLQVKYNNSNY